jgi:hypothetical protein
VRLKPVGAGVRLVEVGLDGVEALGGALLVDHRLGDPHGHGRVDVEEVLGVARELVAEDASRLVLAVVRGRDAFLARRVVVTGNADFDVAHDVRAEGVQGSDRRGGLMMPSMS